jgi:hypothetical protein
MSFLSSNKKEKEQNRGDKKHRPKPMQQEVKEVIRETGTWIWTIITSNDK